MILATDWWAVDWQLCHDGMGGCNGLTPAAIDEMTLAEIALLASGDPHAGGGEVWSDAQIAAEFERLHAMTPLERLDAALNGEL